jgi:hypothetical protein
LLTQAQQKARDLLRRRKPGAIVRALRDFT